MKTARFERLSFIDNAVLAVLIASMTVFSFPVQVDAQTINKTSLVFEIKNFQTIKIPDTDAISKIVNNDIETTEVQETAPEPTPAPVEVKPAKKTIPPKAVNKVYMHEPEIREYICPKLGDKCNVFIAVLKAENGTHECTRDNRGLNRNGSVDIGLAQINWSPKSPYTFEQLQDCKFNLNVALEMYSRRGLQPWYAYTKGAYKKHLPAVLANAKAIADAKQQAALN